METQSQRVKQVRWHLPRGVHLTWSTFIHLPWIDFVLQSSLFCQGHRCKMSPNVDPTTTNLEQEVVCSMHPSGCKSWTSCAFASSCASPWCMFGAHTHHLTSDVDIVQPLAYPSLLEGGLFAEYQEKSSKRLPSWVPQLAGHRQNYVVLVLKSIVNRSLRTFWVAILALS